MSVIPPENTNHLEHEKLQHAEAVRHSTEHREHIHNEKHDAVEGVVVRNPDSSSSVESQEEQTATVWTFKSIIATVGLSGLYVGSQIPLYFVGGSLSFISADIGGVEAQAWLAVCYALVLSAVAPFCGYMQDLFGRRNITLGGGLSLIMGCIILATAKNLGPGIVGMGFAGAGAAIGELTALAG